MRDRGERECWRNRDREGGINYTGINLNCLCKKTTPDPQRG